MRYRSPVVNPSRPTHAAWTGRPQTMSFIPRTVNSLRNRGFVATLRSARRHFATHSSRFIDRRFDHKQGTETSAVVETAEQTDVASANLARGIRYEPTRARPLRRLLREAGITPRGTFVDIGCGKGRVLMLAAAHGFPHVTGVDYSPALCAAARQNLDILRRRTGLQFQAAVHAMDAVDYAFQPDDAVVFLFNPFDEMVLRRVVDNLSASLGERPRELRLIYHRPLWRGVIEESQLFGAADEYCFGGCDFAVYRTPAGPA
jgi:SAM-dependent methyltransferase